MKTGEAALALGVERTTIINWINDYGLERFFSVSALGKDGKTQRTLTQEDLLVLNTIRHCRARKMTWEATAQYLDEGHREQEFPQNAISADTRTISIQQAEQSSRAAATMAERNAALEQISQLRTQVEKLEEQLKEAREELKLEQQERREELKLEQQGRREDIERLTKEHRDEVKTLLGDQMTLMKRIGELENELKRHQGGVNNDGK